MFGQFFAAWSDSYRSSLWFYLDHLERFYGHSVFLVFCVCGGTARHLPLAGWPLMHTKFKKSLTSTPSSWRPSTRFSNTIPNLLKGKQDCYKFYNFVSYCGIFFIHMCKSQSRVNNFLPNSLCKVEKTSFYRGCTGEFETSGVHSC